MLIETPCIEAILGIIAYHYSDSNVLSNAACPVELAREINRV
jgi:hypothetical protein